MSFVSLVYLVLFSYAITPILRAQDVEEDERLQEWLEDIEDDEEDSPLTTEADVASAKADEAVKPAEESTPAVQPSVVKPAEQQPAAASSKAATSDVTKVAPTEPTKEQSAAAAATATPSADAKVEGPKTAEQAAATTSAPVAATDTAKTGAPTEGVTKAPAADAPAPVKEADKSKTEMKTEVPAADTKPEAAKPQEQETKAAESVKAQEKVEDAPTEKAAQKAPEIALKPAEEKPVVEEPKQAEPEEKPSSDAAPTTPIKPEVSPLPEPPKPVVLTPEQQKQAAAEVEQGEIEGIDTVDLDSAEGNWLFKKIWWEKSNNLYGKIRATVDQIAEARMHFYTEHMRIDRDLLDPFYTSVGFDQGQLTEIADTLLTQLEKKRQKKGSFDEQELEYYTTVANAKTTIEGFMAAVQSIGQLSNDLRDALVKLVEQLNRVRSYDSEAWRLLQLIALELNDKKAREYYYGVLTQWENIKSIDAYIVGPYSDHFGELVQALQTQTKTIKEALDDLKDKGIKFGIAVQEHLETHEKAEAESKQAKPAPKKGWFDWLWSFFS